MVSANLRQCDKTNVEAAASIFFASTMSALVAILLCMPGRRAPACPSETGRGIDNTLISQEIGTTSDRHITMSPFDMCLKKVQFNTTPTLIVVVDVY
jgi:hypothetical protein